MAPASITPDEAREQLKAAVKNGPYAGLMRDYFGAAGNFHPAAVFGYTDALIHSPDFATIRQQTPVAETRAVLDGLDIDATVKRAMLAFFDNPGTLPISPEVQQSLDALRGLLLSVQDRPGCLPGVAGLPRRTTPPPAPTAPSIQGFARWQEGRAGAAVQSALPGTLLYMRGTGFAAEPSGNTVTFDGVPAYVWRVDAGGLVVAVPAPRVIATPRGQGQMPALDFRAGSVTVAVRTQQEAAAADQSFTIHAPPAGGPLTLEEIVRRGAAVMRGFGTAIAQVPDVWAPFVSADLSGGLPKVMANLPAVFRQLGTWFEALERVLPLGGDDLRGPRELAARVASATGLEDSLHALEQWLADPNAKKDPCTKPLRFLDFLVQVWVSLTAFFSAVVAALLTIGGLVLTIVILAWLCQMYTWLSFLITLLLGGSLVVIGILMLLCYLAQLGGLSGP